VSQWSRVRAPDTALPSNNLAQVVHTHVHPSPNSITWYRRKQAHNADVCLRATDRCRSVDPRGFIRTFYVLFIISKFTNYDETMTMTVRCSWGGWWAGWSRINRTDWTAGSGGSRRSSGCCRIHRRTWRLRPARIHWSTR